MTSTEAKENRVHRPGLVFAMQTAQIAGCYYYYSTVLDNESQTVLFRLVRRDSNPWLVCNDVLELRVINANVI